MANPHILRHKNSKGNFTLALENINGDNKSTEDLIRPVTEIDPIKPAEPKYQWPKKSPTNEPGSYRPPGYDNPWNWDNINPDFNSDKEKRRGNYKIFDETNCNR